MKTLARLAKNPAVRSVVRKGARAGVTYAAGRIGRKRGGGKTPKQPQRGKKVPQGDPSSLARRGNSLPVTDFEMIRVVDSNDTSANGQAWDFIFDPTSTVLPKLSAKAKGYTKYKINGLTFSYSPSSSASTGGVVAMGWFDNPTVQAEKWDTTEMVQGISPSVSGQYYQKDIFPLVPTVDSKKVYLINDHSSVVTTSPSTYFPGILVSRAQGTSTGAKEAGKITCSYNITFLDSTPDNSVDEASGTWEFTTGGMTTVTDHGLGIKYLYLDPGAPDISYFTGSSVAKMELKVIDFNGAAASTVVCEEYSQLGVLVGAIAPVTATPEEVAATHTVWHFNLGRMSYRRYFLIHTHSGGDMHWQISKADPSQNTWFYQP